MKFINTFSTIMLFIIALCLVFVSYKHAESVINPVIANFSINKIDLKDKTVTIAGTYKKIRNCEFIDAVAFDDDFLLIDFGVQKSEVKSASSYDTQSFANWTIKAHNKKRIESLVLYSLHQCKTGFVMTKLNNKVNLYD